MDQPLFQGYSFHYTGHRETSKEEEGNIYVNECSLISNYLLLKIYVVMISKGHIKSILSTVCKSMTHFMYELTKKHYVYTPLAFWQFSPGQLKNFPGIMWPDCVTVTSLITLPRGLAKLSECTQVLLFPLLSRQL